MQLAFEPLHKGIRNESLDLAVYNLACLNSMNLDWDNLEVEVSGEVPAQPETTVYKLKSRKVEIF